MTTADIADLRLHNQRLSHTDLTTPADVVRWFGAMQAQDLPSALYAIGLRMPSATEAMVEQAIADKTIVRSWPMRGTIHFMLAEDARWMIKLLAPRLDAKVANNYRKAGLTTDVLTRAGKIITSELQGGKQLTRLELYTALNAAGIETGAQGGEQRGMHIFVHWARNGLICITPRRGKQQTFALLDEWVPLGIGSDLTGDGALAELATRYFMSHGPATIKDFAWWSGLSITEAKRGLQQVTHNFEHESIDDIVYWFPPNTSDARSYARQAFLLPPYDEYTVAYADRSAVIDPAMLRAAKYGIGPNIIIDGRIFGTWKRTLKKDKVIISTELLSALDVVQKTALTAAADRYGTFLQLKAVLA